jgi:GTP-binding protein
MQIIKAEYLVSSPSIEKCPDIKEPEYAFIGRSNVGKSSLINMVTGRAGLAKTSGTPGKTQMINHFRIDSRKAVKERLDTWYLVDLPGYGYAKVSQKDRKTWGKMIHDYLHKRKNLITTFVLIDSRHSPQAIDVEFVNSLGAAQLSFVIVFTKSDKEKLGVVKRNIQLFSNALLETWEQLPPIISTSATKKIGQEEILNYIETCNIAVK